MTYIEREFLKKESIKPWVWFRYIDDIFFIWLGTDTQLKNFQQSLNNFNPNLKYAFEKSREKVNFLDVTVKVESDNIVTDLFCKSVDSHQYFHYDSSHPKHVKSSIIHSQTLRLQRICSEEKDFIKHLDQLRVWFKARGYPGDLIESQIQKALRKRNSFGSKKSESGVPLVVTYNPKLDRLGNILFRHRHVLSLNDEAEKVFTPAPFVSFRSSRNLKSHLVRSKVYP